MSQAKLGVSIIICCHNSSLRLPRTIEHINKQIIDNAIPWEVIVVDNASTDNTAQVALDCWDNKSSAALQVITEPKLGLSNARRKGISEAKYEFVSFIDDDNWIFPEWIQTVYDVMARHPEVGVCGGYSEAVYETTPPEWLQNYKENYAVGPENIVAGDITLTRGFVWGAGMTVRRNAYNSLIKKGFQSFLSGRAGVSLSSGEDSELCLALRLAGWRIWYEPKLSLKHFLPKERMTWKYLKRLYRGFGASSVGLDPYLFVLKHKSSLKKTSFWQLGAAVIEVIKLYYRIYIKMLKAEGDSNILALEYRKGRIGGLLRNLTCYTRNIASVESAQWLLTR